MREEKHADAERDDRLVLDRFPADANVIANLAACYQQQGKLSDAERVLRKGARTPRTCTAR